MRTPGRCGHVDGRLGVVAAVVEASEELGSDLQSPGPPQTLHCSDLGECQEKQNREQRSQINAHPSLSIFQNQLYLLICP